VPLPDQPQRKDDVYQLESEDLTVRLPSHEGGDLDQDEEYCEVLFDGHRKRIRFHDYAEIYKVPGLYERLFVDLLGCDSPRTVTDLLHEQLERDGKDTDELKVLDFGAGNGMVGEELARIGVESMVGVDLLDEAKDAAERDRPDLYDDYHAVDMTALPEENRRALERHDFNCVTCVAALGFGDVPPEAFATAFNLVSTPGWVVFNIRERFTGDEDSTGFADLLSQMLDEGTIVERARKRYPHRLSVSGDPLPYIAVVAEKRDDLPLEWVST
jgi:predicted TPR repeat methyltransferase